MNGFVASASISDDGALIAVSNVDRGFDIYSLASGDPLCTIKHKILRKLTVWDVTDFLRREDDDAAAEVRVLYELPIPKEAEALAVAGHYLVDKDEFLIAAGVMNVDSPSPCIIWKTVDQDQDSRNVSQESASEDTAFPERSPPPFCSSLFSIKKADSGPTFLDFASPTPPFHVRIRVPTILRVFGGDEPNVVAMKVEPPRDPLWTQPRSPRRSFSEASTASVAPPGRNISSRTPTPAASYASTPTPSSRSATPGPSRIPPSASRPGTPSLSRTSARIDEDPYVESVASGVTTRASARIAHRNAQKNVIPGASSDSAVAAFPSSDPYDYERTDVPCTQTQEEKAAERKGKGRAAAQQPETAWWHIKVKKNAPPPIASQALAHPPDLTSFKSLCFGDLFYHRSIRGVQLWMWSENPGTLGEWVPVLLGISRSIDDRVLSLTPSVKPSWTQKKWFRRSKNTVPVFILPQ
ncbi:hypothetical protein K466DRAFT_606093 [Polyporus arcularius HHB13444]|uniref:Uncharacterized protein n=1 Tax=Polyporus arcularius HHB13444 TaxID=1314778 RepID=A0A5C3NR50_9APHY|nr:hypothetical protein K466DRAFT_606093 [Polyporus arcularius HHB13444]